MNMPHGPGEGESVHLARHHRPLFAMSLRLIAMVTVAVMFSAVKMAHERGVNIVEVLFYRQLFALPVVIFGIACGLVPGGIHTRRFSAHASRAVIGMISMFLSFLSYMMLPLSEATVIAFSAPIFATLVSGLTLREHTGIHRWAAILVGFAGVVVIINPGHQFQLPLVGVCVAIGSAISIAIVSILLRDIGRTEEPGTTVLYFSALPLLPLAGMMIFFAHGHDGQTMLLLLAMGIIGGLGQILMTTALRHGPVSTVLPMDYSALLWTTIIGWAVWKTWPAPTTAVGAPLIIGSGLYIAWREHRRMLPPSPPATFTD